MPIGSVNPIPFRIGGGPTPTQRAYRTLRQAVGKGGSASNELGIEALWRRSEAKGLAAASSHTRRALLQAWPFLATDLLPYYERILGIVPATGATEAARRDVVVPLWAKRVNNVTPTLVEELAAIDSRLTLFEAPHDQAGTAQFGRSFAPLEPGLESPAFGIARGHCVAPEYSTDAIVRVRFAVLHTGPLTAAELVVVERVKSILRGFLPSTTDYEIAVDDGLGAPGLWHLGSTPLGFGGLG